MSEELDLSKKLAAEVNRRMMAMIGVTNTVAQPTAEPLTIDTLRRAMLKMPPRETWLSSRIFPADKAITVSGSGENFTCAHPGFWLRLQDTIRRTAEPKPAHLGNPFGMNLTPIEIDPWPEDSPETAEWRAAHWGRLREAFEVAITPLPEWLRSPRKFGKHG